MLKDPSREEKRRRRERDLTALFLKGNSGQEEKKGPLLWLQRGARKGTRRDKKERGYSVRGVGREQRADKTRQERGNNR